MIYTVIAEVVILCYNMNDAIEEAGKTGKLCAPRQRNGRKVSKVMEFL